MATGDPIERLREAMRPWLERYTRPTWRPIVKEAESTATASRFGGMPWLKAGEDWPSCTTCGEPLQFFLQLDLARLPPELGDRFGGGLLQLFYCTNDGCSANHWEAFSSGKLVRIIDANESGDEVVPTPEPQVALVRPKAITGWKPEVDRPAAAEYERLGLKFTFDFKRRTVRLESPADGFSTEDFPKSALEGLPTSHLGDKLGGWPAWIQGPEYPTCPRCGRLMQFVFQVDSDDNIPFGFGDGGAGHITQCPVHTDTVTFAWACF
jgi:uncharacterized protein YwqG